MVRILMLILVLIMIMMTMIMMLIEALILIIIRMMTVTGRDRQRHFRRLKASIHAADRCALGQVRETEGKRAQNTGKVQYMRRGTGEERYEEVRGKGMQESNNRELRPGTGSRGRWPCIFAGCDVG